MDDIVQTLGTPRMIAALEVTLEEEMIFFGRVLEGGEIYYDGEIEGFYTGRGHLNGILRAHLHQQDTPYVEASIKRVLRYFQYRQVSEIGWSVGQNCQPTNLGLHLERYGFRRLDEENIGMALDVENVREEEMGLEDLEIKEITDLSELTVMRKLEREGFGSTEELAQNYYEMYARAGFGSGTVWRHFSGWWRGEAVASTSLLFHAGVVGIFGVATIPAVRRRGIARAMVLHAIHQARVAGYRIVVLSPTDMSEGIYRRLGFRDYTRIRHYTFMLA